MDESKETMQRFYQHVISTFGSERGDELFRQFVEEGQRLNPDGVRRASYAFVAMRRYLAEHPLEQPDLESQQ